MRDHDRVTLGEVLQDRRRHDVIHRHHPERADLLGMGKPAHVVAAGLLLPQPQRERLQVRGPLATLSVGHDEVTQCAVQLAQQAGDEGGVAPSRLQR